MLQIPRVSIAKCFRAVVVAVEIGWKGRERERKARRAFRANEEVVHRARFFVLATTTNCLAMLISRESLIWSDLRVLRLFRAEKRPVARSRSGEQVPPRRFFSSLNLISQKPDGTNAKLGQNIRFSPMSKILRRFFLLRSTPNIDLARLIKKGCELRIGACVVLQRRLDSFFMKMTWICVLFHEKVANNCKLWTSGGEVDNESGNQKTNTRGEHFKNERNETICDSENAYVSVLETF